jgi:hypothetical protein
MLGLAREKRDTKYPDPNGISRSASNLTEKGFGKVDPCLGRRRYVEMGISIMSAIFVCSQSDP